MRTSTGIRSMRPSARVRARLRESSWRDRIASSATSRSGSATCSHSTSGSGECAEPVPLEKLAEHFVADLGARKHEIMQATGKLQHRDARPERARPARDLAPAENDVGFVRMRRKHRALQAQARVHPGMAVADRRKPAVVRRKAVDRLQREIEVPLAAVVAMQALHVGGIYSPIGEKRKPAAERTAERKLCALHAVDVEVEERAVEP